ncbi:glucocorticoid modulatory element-binding protein 1 isoform X2 [Mauremys mutica]|uniref:glucocorticoid modulatory element-binding protein 1 isoform X2 n=1 Tax=Mauremys mutica TaxID=74926 RepID=UPI001D16DCC8|nr:glucocorticoid modulatory element-binding protein 1 isoform X2 [Mauremys mutica]
MANAEVSVPVGDVVVVPSEGNEGENPEDTKTQVILQLQPVQQGIYEEGSETSAAVVAVETHTIHKLEEGIDPSTIETNEEIEIAYPITCGESKAILLWKKFVCPGINVKCVKFNDQLISPKHFVHLAGKSTLKDWKRAIRLGGIMLRKMMDSGQIDFYQHDKVCTNTCRSTKFDLLISSARAPVPGQQTSVVQTPTSADGSITQIALSEESMEEGIEWNSALTAAVTMATEEGIKKDTEEISEDTLMFWKGIADVGLMEEVVCNIQKEIEEVLKGVQQRLGQSPFQITDAAVLNNVAHTFGLMDTVKKVLDNRKSQTEQGEEQFLYTLADLERQLEEQKKLARDQKIKSQTIQNVVLMPVSAPKPPKRPRLQRPASATVLSSSTPVQQPQFTVISPIAIAPMGQQFSVGNIPVATISQGSSPVTLHTLPSSQLFRYATVVSSSKSSSSDTVTLHPSSSLALLSSAAMQDSGGLANMATVVNPVELVAMESGLTSTIQAVEGTSEDGQTIIEIDPAPDPEAETEESEGKAVILETELRTEEKVMAEVEDHQHQSKNGKSWRNMERPKKRLHLHGVMDKINRFCREEGGVILQTRRGEHLSFLRAHSDTVHSLVFAQAWSLLGLFYLRETLWPVTGALILLLEGVDYCFGGNRYLIFYFFPGKGILSNSSLSTMLVFCFWQGNSNPDCSVHCPLSHTLWFLLFVFVFVLLCSPFPFPDLLAAKVLKLLLDSVTQILLLSFLAFSLPGLVSFFAAGHCYKTLLA